MVEIASFSEANWERESGLTTRFSGRRAGRRVRLYLRRTRPPQRCGPWAVLSLKALTPMPFPVDTKWITQTEEKLGVRFPASFVTAMSQMNGGAVRTRVDHFELFPFLDASDRKRIQRTCGSIDRETTTARKDSYGFPQDAVAIGANGGGDLLVLIPMPDHPATLQHSIYWWDHETGEIEQVADDFGDLTKT